MIWLEPLVEVERDGLRYGYGPVAPEDVAWLAEAIRSGGEHPLALGPVEDLPWMRGQTRLTFARVGVIDPLSTAEYEAHGGLAGLRRALEAGPEETVEEVTASGLRGRGGAGFPTGIKWKTVAGAEAAQKYIVCNADEGDSGSFADRMLMEGDPLTLIEGMAIAGLAVGATQGYVYIRSEYPDAIRQMQAAIAVARQAGMLGRFGSGLRPGLSIWRCASAPAPMSAARKPACSNSLEGKRGTVRAKPPMPALEGFLGRPDGGQ